MQYGKPPINPGVEAILRARRGASVRGQVPAPATQAPLIQHTGTPSGMTWPMPMPDEVHQWAGSPPPPATGTLPGIGGAGPTQAQQDAYFNALRERQNDQNNIRPSAGTLQNNVPYRAPGAFGSRQQAQAPEQQWQSSGPGQEFNQSARRFAALRQVRMRPTMPPPGNMRPGLPGPAKPISGMPGGATKPGGRGSQGLARK